ncbi:N-alpha-acetyltransferase 30A-like [Ochlerotatus camptorhynchus]|uniref:N-alpha-acetyltransferase 30A-like n=1 Tax=Ochlerotatus camptorhynchus TaxID=644619 RepID=UPI0031D7F624
MEVKTEENLAPQANGLEANATSAAGKSGKKKAKRKNKSKNTIANASQEQQEEEETRGSTGKLNGLAEDLQDKSVEKVSQKLEQGLKLGKNGLTNGTLSGSEDHQAAKTETVGVTGKKKHKNRQKNKNQPVVVGGSDQTPAQSSEVLKKDAPEPVITVIPTNETPPVIAPPEEPPKPTITYQVYESELQMPCIMSLIQKDLSEPYSIYTYRYFIHNWPRLCFLAWHEERCVGAIVCKLDIHRQNIRRGYIAMLAVDKDYRKLKIGTTLVQKAIQAMLEDNADEVVLETEITNRPALRLYENLGFVRDKRLFHYYLNGVDALRLKLWFR